MVEHIEQQLILAKQQLSTLLEIEASLFTMMTLQTKILANATGKPEDELQKYSFELFDEFLKKITVDVNMNMEGDSNPNKSIYNVPYKNPYKK